MAVVDHHVVVAASPAARAEGIVPGLRRRQAESRCPRLLVVPHDPGRDARAFEPVVEAVEAFTPAVEVLEPGSCMLATRGPSRLFGGDESLVARVAVAVDAVLAAGTADPVPVPCRVGVADGRFAAEQAARQGVVVPPGGSPAFLASLPVATLDRPQLADLLVRLGIRTLGQLAELPAAAVLARFGPEGEEASALARGLDPRALRPRPVPPDLTVAAELDPPAERSDAAAFVARSLAESLCSQLAGGGLAVTVLRVEAETVDGNASTRRWRLDRELPPAAVADRVRWQLEAWLSPTTAGDPSEPAGGGGGEGGVARLRLVPEEVEAEGRQPGFWGEDGPRARRAGRALARVQGALGPGSVVTAVAGVWGRGPGDRVELLPWGEPAAAPGPPAPWPGRLPSPLPVLVHASRLPAEVVDARGAPIGVDARGEPSAPPVRLSVAGAPPRAVAAWAGPWPADERWWDRAAHRRRARCQLLTDDGHALLVVLERGRWWVEASYD